MIGKYSVQMPGITLRTAIKVSLVAGGGLMLMFRTRAIRHARRYAATVGPLTINSPKIEAGPRLKDIVGIESFDGSIRPIVQCGNPVLRQVAGSVAKADIDSPQFRNVIKSMIGTMRAAPGVGLAGPQIGLPLRLVVIEDRFKPASVEAEADYKARERVRLPLRVLVNPTLSYPDAGRPEDGVTTACFHECCLSVHQFHAEVKRWRTVHVSALDERGNPVEWTVRGWPARILQHEVDHLNGMLYIDRMNSKTFTNSVPSVTPKPLP